MARRSKQQIKEDNDKRLKNKEKILDRLNTHLNEVSRLSKEDRNKVDEFINLFLKCETVYKTLYPAMKKLKDDEQIDVRGLTFNIQKFEAALRYFGISFDHDKMNKMFYSTKSYLTCRDRIIHGLDMSSINEVLSNYEDMEATMKELLDNVANGKPE